MSYSHNQREFHPLQYVGWKTEPRAIDGRSIPWNGNLRELPDREENFDAPATWTVGYGVRNPYAIDEYEFPQILHFQHNCSHMRGPKAYIIHASLYKKVRWCGNCRDRRGGFLEVPTHSRYGRMINLQSYQRTLRTLSRRNLDHPLHDLRPEDDDDNASTRARAGSPRGRARQRPRGTRG